MRKKVTIALLILFFIGGTLLYLFQDYLDWGVVEKQPEENKKPQISEPYLSQEELAEKAGEKIDKLYKTETELRYGDNSELYDYAGTVTYKFISYLNENDYESAYQMIPEEYKKNYTKEMLKKDFNFMGKEKGLEIKSFENMGEYYLLNVNIVDFEIDENVDVSEYEVEPQQVTFTIYENEKLIPKRHTTKESKKISTEDISEEISKINIVGIDSFYSTYNIQITGIESINNNLKLAISLMPTISKDLEKPNVDINTYFEVNKDLLFDIYGIKEKNEFLELAKKIKGINEINNSSVDLKHVEEIGNIVDTRLIITTPNKTINFTLRVVREQIQDKMKYYAFIK